MKKEDFKIGNEFLYNGSKYKINSESLITGILTNDLTYVIYSWNGYFGSVNEVNENGFTFYTSIMGDLFQKHILYKDCKLIKQTK